MGALLSLLPMNTATNTTTIRDNNNNNKPNLIYFTTTRETSSRKNHLPIIILFLGIFDLGQLTIRSSWRIAVLPLFLTSFCQNISMVV